MSIFIKHRIADPENVDPSWGVEIDMHNNIAQQKSLHLSHAPWALGDSFVQWLQVFSGDHRGPPPLKGF